MYFFGLVLDCDLYFGFGRVFVCEDFMDDYMSVLCGVVVGVLIVMDRIKYLDIYGEFIVE